MRLSYGGGPVKRAIRVFPLGPLGLILLVALWEHQWGVPVSAAIVALPFATAAALTRGRGLGWGNVEIAALGGAVLGAPLALFVLAVACLAVVVVSALRGRTGTAPLVFYVIVAIAVAIPIGVVLSPNVRH